MNGVVDIHLAEPTVVLLAYRSKHFDNLRNFTLEHKRRVQADQQNARAASGTRTLEFFFAPKSG